VVKNGMHWDTSEVVLEVTHLIKAFVGLF
jgi:hypothetical protein